MWRQLIGKIPETTSQCAVHRTRYASALSLNDSTQCNNEKKQRRINHNYKSITSSRVASVAFNPHKRVDFAAQMPSAQLQQQRYVTLIALRGGAVIVSAFFTYIGVQVFNRLPFRQRGYIRKQLSTPPRFHELDDDQHRLWLHRPNKIRFLVALLSGTPNGPLVVTGPEGSGKTGLLRQMLHGRPNTVYIDMREHPVSSGHEFLEMFVRECGYLLPPNELLGRAVFTPNATMAKVTDKALECITQVLRELKRDGMWKDDTPTIVLDEVARAMSSHKSNEHGEVIKKPWRDDKDLQVFLDWCLFLTSSRLAHVILAASPEVADELDSVVAFQMRRQKLHIDYPRNSSIRQFFRDSINPYLQCRAEAYARQVLEAEQLGQNVRKRVAQTAIDRCMQFATRSRNVNRVEQIPSQEKTEQSESEVKDDTGVAAGHATPAGNSLCRPLSDAEIEAIITSLGGHLNDIDVLVGYIAQGQPWQSALQRLLADSVEQVENLLEGTLEGEYPGDQDTFLTEAPSDVATTKEAWELSARVVHRYKCFLRCFAMIELLAQRKWMHRQELINQVFSDSPSEIDEYVDQGLLMCVNLNSSAKIVLPSAQTSPGNPSNDESASNVDMSRLGVHGRYVSAATPRIRTAFKGVCHNNRMALLRQRIRAKLNLHALRLKQQQLQAELRESLSLHPVAFKSSSSSSSASSNECKQSNDQQLSDRVVRLRVASLMSELDELRDVITQVVIQLTSSVQMDSTQASDVVDYNSTKSTTDTLSTTSVMSSDDFSSSSDSKTTKALVPISESASTALTLIPFGTTLDDPDVRLSSEYNTTDSSFVGYDNTNHQPEWEHASFASIQNETDQISKSKQEDTDDAINKSPFVLRHPVTNSYSDEVVRSKTGRTRRRGRFSFRHRSLMDDDDQVNADEDENVRRGGKPLTVGW